MQDEQQYGPGFQGAARPWGEALRRLGSSADAKVVANRGWDLAWERLHWEKAAANGEELVSVRVYDDEVIIGPRWVPGTDSGCASCAEVRERNTAEHPLATTLDAPRAVPRAVQPMLPLLLDAAVDNLAEHPLSPGELYAVGARYVRRHRIPRSFFCPACADHGSVLEDSRRPEPLKLPAEPLSSTDPTRGAGGAHLIEPGTLRGRLLDARFGPVQAIMRESNVPFAMSMCLAPDAAAPGHGRAGTFAEADPVGIIETYERLGSFPFDTPLLLERSHREVADRALDPTTLGQHTEKQLAHPSCQVLPYTPDTPMDWVWGHDLASGDPLLVPAEAGFYQYEQRFKLSRHAARAARVEARRARAAGHPPQPGTLRKYFHDSSSGCAAGSSLAEAALHSLLELAERDAFLLSWHRRQPLPRIANDSISDPENRSLIDLIQTRGFDVHILVARQDIDLPIVWVLVVNRKNPFPASYSSGGSGANPDTAIRGALREVAQLVTNKVQWNRGEAEETLDDPWKLVELEQHPQLYTLPEKLSRVTEVLGGPRTTTQDAFPGWPDTLRRASGGTVRGALDHVRALYAAAGLDRIVLVNQTTREHTDTGVSVAKAVVPGILPMCFGHAQQRLMNLPRLAAALAGTSQENREIPYDPHPFP
ncbi:TOMM precursor leader peptide-binding protein [Streptomyces sp. NBC_00006]|uniref:TOMM precursor leader peptide-binding protein n=1 Tax=unclassified Streptomyces TaxID=2593676 RepID=UPI002250124E|nr:MULTISPECIES: TOMM precursor leader peptide-binding protein [unclassified Streptomyces]MCX4834196.1 TOMM precursor leader peptide-binding protein [Streptomyces sp. NBC_01016]MCX5529893.1 TOMM precursor leader peptide-binding protein [Streptomyces sp. NBC_00006]